MALLRAFRYSGRMSRTAFAGMVLATVAAPQVESLSAPLPDQRPLPNPRPPRLILGDYVSDADYPASARRAGIEGRVDLRLRVSAAGRVTRCTVIRSSGSQVLDTTACRVLHARARFFPATNRRGRAVAGFVNHGVRWTLPRRR